MALFEHIVANATPNATALENMVNDVLKARENAKQRQNTILSYLVTYGIYGKNSPVFATQLNEKELKAISPEFLISKIQEWMSYKHFMIYYGPDQLNTVVNGIKQTHSLANLKDIPAEVTFYEDVTSKDRVFVVDYESPQVILYSISHGDKYDKELTPKITLYNEYFGGSMNSIVFQEMREARALAYTAMSVYSSPSDLNICTKTYLNIACGNDKMFKPLKPSMS